MGHVTTEALAMALTDVVTPFVPVRETTNPQGRALPNDPVAQFRYLDADAVDYEIKGFGIFAGATMTHYICDDAGATIYQKTAGLILDVILYITARSGDQATFTFSDDLTAPVATEVVPGLVRLATPSEAQVTSNHSNLGVLSVLRGWQQTLAWWTALTKVSLRNKLVMATAQQARGGTGRRRVMTAELTSVAITALTPDTGPAHTSSPTLAPTTGSKSQRPAAVGTIWLQVYTP